MLAKAGQNIRIFCQLQMRYPLISLFNLLRPAIYHMPVSDRRGTDGTICRQAGHTGVIHLASGCDLYNLDPCRILQLNRAADQRNARPFICTGFGNRMPLLARGMISDIAHWINRLKSRARSNQNMPPGQRLRRARQGRGKTRLKSRNNDR